MQFNQPSYPSKTSLQMDLALNITFVDAKIE